MCEHSDPAYFQEAWLLRLSCQSGCTETANTSGPLQGPGHLSTQPQAYFLLLLPGTLSLLDINPTVAPVTLSAHLLSDLIVSYSVSKAD